MREQQLFELVVDDGGKLERSGYDIATTAAAAAGAKPTVLAAASLTKVFPMIDPNAKFTFSGSDALEAQIEQGAPADVFAAASPKQPAMLSRRA